jgi:cell pole-organizing protein PopZ
MSFSNSDHPKDGAGEPSMEEILASIRRILKDEAVKSPAPELDDDILVLDSSMLARPVDLSTATSPPTAALPATETPATPLQSTAAPLHFASEPALTSPIYTPPPAAPEPDLLIAPAAEPLPEPAILKPASLSPPPIAPVFGGRSLADYPVLPPEPPAAATPSEPAPAAAPKPAPDPVQEPERAPTAYFANPPMPAKQPSAETKMPEQQDNLTPPTSLVSDQVTAAAANSIGAMLRSLNAEKSVAISRQSLTIEDMVREEIRPLLKAWLDTNLAGMVERVVRTEIEKVLERSTS